MKDLGYKVYISDNVMETLIITGTVARLYSDKC
jgi:hypothetical protein